MKRIINGRLWDENFMDSIVSRTFDMKDPVTGEIKQYRETLLREYALKPGHTLADTWVEGTYGRRIVKDNCDPHKGQFLLKRNLGYSDGIFILLSDEEAKAWFEKWCPDETDRYQEVFGLAENPWTGDGTVKLVEQAESRMNSMKWDKEHAEKRANEAEAKIAQLEAKLETALSKLADPEV